MKILIGGGTGFIGRHLTKTLKSHGHSVEVISRTSGPGRITWDKLKADKTLPECDAVVNLSGEYVLNVMRRWNDAYKSDVRSSRIETNKLLVKLMTEGKTQPKVWIAGTAEGYYPRSNTKEFNEDYHLDLPKGYMQNLCADWEQSATLPENINIRQCTVRTGVVLGRDGGLIQQSYWPFYFGLGGVIGSGNQYISWIHINDIINIFKYAIENEHVAGVLNGTSPNPCSMTEFTKAYGSALNRPTIFPVPEFLINFGVGSDRAPFMLEGSKVIPQNTLKVGYKYEFENIEDAMTNIVNS